MRKNLSGMLAAALLCVAAVNPVQTETVRAAEANAAAPELADASADKNGRVEAADETKLTDSAADTVEAGADSPANPVHHCSSDGDSDTTDWSYVYFGSYPQTEVTGSALTEAITGASYDTNGDAWVGNTKYRRISKADTNNSSNFGAQQYRYFKWERIRWRVLQKSGDDLFVIADRGLDCKDYHDPGGSVTWENSAVRSWLNKDFYDTAFADAEQGAIAEQTIDNEDNPAYGTDGGNNTRDKVFLLSIAEAANQSYGFCNDYNTFSASRRLGVSDYAHARGAYISPSGNDAGNCLWWLRSPGYDTGNAAYVYYDGYVYRDGYDVYSDLRACVPALHMNLSSDLWYMTDDGTSGFGGDAAPPVLGTLQGQTAKEGTAVTFRVTASGGSPSHYTYQWYFAPNALSAGTPIAGATASSYTIPGADVTAGLNGSCLYCVVSNGVYEVTSSRARLTVQSAGAAANPGGSGGGTTNSGGSGGSTATPGGSGGASTPGGSAQKPATKLQTPKVKASLSSAKAIKLTWGKVKNASGYTIYRAESKKGKYKKIGTAKKTSYTDKKVKSGKTYYYKAQAYKGKTKSSLSGAVSKKIPSKPSAPKLTLTAGGGKFTLSWGSVKYADQVEIYTRVDNGKWKKWKTVAAKKKKITDRINRITFNEKLAFRVRGKSKKDGVTIYGNYSVNSPAMKW